MPISSRIPTLQQQYPLRAAQLAALQADRVALADRVVQPWWYDVALGLLLFGFLASYAVDSLAVTKDSIAEGWQRSLHTDAPASVLEAAK